jgi:hypothetical protein
MKWLDERILILNENDFVINKNRVHSYVFNIKSHVHKEMLSANIVVKIDNNNNIALILKNRYGKPELSSLPQSMIDIIMLEIERKIIPPKINKFYYIANNCFE